MIPRSSLGRRGFMRLLARSVAIAALSVGCAVVLAVAAHPTPRDPIYSVDQVYAGLWVHPSAWIGRTVRVRGVEISASDYRGNAWGQLLSTTWRPGISTNDVISLVIVPQPPDPWLARLRRLPLPAVIGRVLPQPQAPHNGQPAVYRLTLHDPNSCTALTSPCPAGVVVDAQAQGW